MPAKKPVMARVPVGGFASSAMFADDEDLILADGKEDAVEVADIPRWNDARHVNDKEMQNL